MKFFKKLKIELLYDPAVVPFLCIYPKELKLVSQTCTLIFVAALFMIITTSKQSKYVPVAK